VFQVLAYFPEHYPKFTVRGDAELDAPTLLKARKKALAKWTNLAAQMFPNRFDACRLRSDENCTRFFVTGNSTF
jgi:hypothetical protein